MAALQPEPDLSRGGAVPRLLLGLLVLLVIGAAAYGIYAYRDGLRDLFGIAAPEPATADIAVTATPGGPAAANPVADAEIVPAGAIFYMGESEGGVPAAAGTAVWTFVADPAGAHLDVRIEVPERGLSFDLVMRKATDATPGASHVIEVVATVPADLAGGVIQSIVELAAKSSEEAIGTVIVATTAAIEANHFALELGAAAEGRNMSQMRQEWFDLGVVFGNGEQAILTFNKGTAGHEAMRAALAAWGA